MDNNPRKGDESKNTLVNSSIYNSNDNVISWSNTPNGGSASWSAGCSNERVGTITIAGETSGWSSSFNKMGKSLANIKQPYRIVSVKKKKIRPYYVLKIFIDSTENYDLYKKYVAAAKKNNDVVNKYKSGGDGPVYFDAGFDLFAPYQAVISDSRTGSTVHKLDHLVKCSMMKVDADADGEEFRAPVGYYMYPRSSTGTKTPLRLANSVGIIDSGYRGHIIAAFDAPPSFSCTGGAYTVEAFQRLVQICPPDLSYPVEVELVADESLLGDGGNRGGGGFGSTGA